MKDEFKMDELKKELLKVNGTIFKKFNRDIVVDFKITDGHLGIDVIFEDSNPDWWNIYWFMKYDGGLDKVKELNKELNKCESDPKGYYHIVGSATYSDSSWSVPNGAVITVMV